MATDREPLTLRAGDTWSWSRIDADHTAAAGWAVAWHLASAAGHYEQAGSGAGDTWSLTWPAADTAGIPAGIYAWAAVATKAGETLTLASGQVLVQPALTSAVDARSHARKVLDAIEALIENRATIDQQEYTIAGRQLKRMPLPDLLALRTRYRSEVQREDAASAGYDGRNIRVRFGRA